MKRLLLTGLVLWPIACGSTPAMRAAESGDRAALKSAVEQGERSSTLSNREAAALAQTVANREVRGATGPDAWSCAHELDDALAVRMRTHDDAGAEAALARVDGHGLDLGDLRGYLADTDPRWRAAGTRSLVRSDDHAARVQALLAELVGDGGEG